jgi:hypothetical protein
MCTIETSYDLDGKSALAKHALPYVVRSTDELEIETTKRDSGGPRPADTHGSRVI